MKLKHAAEIIMGQSPKSDTYNDKGDGVPFFQGKSDFGELNPTERIYCSSPLKLAKEKDLLISVRAPVGDLNIANQECCIGRGLAAIRSKEGVSNYKYLYYCILNKKEFLQSKSTGSTFKAISKSILEELEIELPNIDIQERIVQVLDKSKDIIKQRKEQIEVMDKLRESIFNYMFGRNKIFENVKLGEFTNHVSSGATPKGGQKVYITQGIPFIRSQNVMMNKIVYDDISYIPIEIHESMNRSKVLKNDVLLNITGASIGRVAVYEGEDNMANVNQHVCIIRLKDDLKPVYVCNYIATNEFQNKIKNMNSGATREALNYDQIKNFIIPKPPIELQNEFAEIVNKIEKEKELLKQSLEQLETNFKALEQKAFNGELFN